MAISRMNNPSDSSRVDYATDDGEATPTKNGPGDAGSRSKAAQYPREIGGPKGPEPTRYGDWEKNGRCIDF